MKTSLLTSVSVSLLCVIYNAHARSFDEHRLDSLLANPKFKPNNLGNVLPGRYIIEFDDGYHGSSLEFVSDVQSLLKNEPALNSRVRMSIAQEYDSPSTIFRGVSISLNNGDADEPQHPIDKHGGELHMQSIHNALLKKILEQNRVKNVYPVTEIPRPKVEVMSSNIDAYAMADDGTIIPNAPDISFNADGPTLPFTHVMTQADQVHRNLKITGKGITIGVIDSGIDYRHPAFGGGFGEGYKVRYGYDLVGNRFNSKDPTSIRQENTPLDTCVGGNGHGTHVAGIIAANDKLFNFTGVAPEATLGVWRIFGCDGATSNDLVMKAMIDAHEAGCDIINLSLGSSSNWADDPTSLVANRISEQGSIIIAAAGNDGDVGAFYMSAPGSGTKVVASASIDNIYNLQQVVLSEEGAEYSYTLSSSTNVFPPGEVVPFTKGEPHEDACGESQPSSTLTGKIALVQRGTCSFDKKALTVEKHGAVGIIIYDNQEGSGFKPQALQSKIPLASIDWKSGTELKRILGTNSKYDSKGIHVEFKTSLSPRRTITGNKVSKFSSVGPLYDMTPKPDLAGPGGFIFSTLPISNGGYGTLSGTSMATPYIAGAFALFMEANGKDKGPNFLKEHFQNYAKPADQLGNHLDNPARQGAGMLQILDAINQSIHVSPGAISFNDTTNIQTQKVTISNPSNNIATYRVFNKQSSAIAPFNTTLQGFAPLSPLIYAPDNVVAEIEFSTNEVTLLPGESAEVTMKVTSIGSSKQPFPVYGGFVHFSSSSPAHKDIHVPYVGVRGSMADIPIFDEGFPQLLRNNSDKVIKQVQENVEFVINRLDRASSYVTVIFRLLTGTAHMVTDVLDTNMIKVGQFSQDFYLARNTLEMTNSIFMRRWNGTMVPNGSNNVGDLVEVKPGSYFLQWKALKLMSDPAKPESWESYISPRILVKN